MAEHGQLYLFFFVTWFLRKNHHANHYYCPAAAALVSVHCGCVRLLGALLAGEWRCWEHHMPLSTPARCVGGGLASPRIDPGNSGRLAWTSLSQQTNRSTEETQTHTCSEKSKRKAIFRLEPPGWHIFSSLYIHSLFLFFPLEKWQFYMCLTALCVAKHGTFATLSSKKDAYSFMLLLWSATFCWIINHVGQMGQQSKKQTNQQKCNNIKSFLKLKVIKKICWRCIDEVLFFFLRLSGEGRKKVFVGRPEENSMTGAINKWPQRPPRAINTSAVLASLFFSRLLTFSNSK